MRIKLQFMEFDNVDDAFEYFVENIYETLDSADISKIKNIIYYYRSGVRGVSDEKKIEILEKFANAKVEKTFRIIL